MADTETVQQECVLVRARAVMLLWPLWAYLLSMSRLWGLGFGALAAKRACAESHEAFRV